jgi:beta-lactamase class A
MLQFFKNKSIPNFAYIIGLLLISILVVLITLDKIKGNQVMEQLSDFQQKSCAIKTYRKTSSNKYTNPLIMTDNNNESVCMLDLKALINERLNQFVNSNHIQTASVYVRNLQNGEWIDINDEATFSPGSLFKLPVFISYLKLSEKDPNLLNTSLAFDIKNAKIPKHTFQTESNVIPGGVYTIKFLLEEMIINSDNNATFLLNNYLEMSTLNQIFIDLQMQVPDMHNRSYSINTKDYSKFLRLLYNGTYLNVSNSEYALSILAKSKFVDGIKKGVKDNVEIARKFGEFGNKSGDTQLHESGIVFIKNNPYVITVMTRGKEIQKMADFIADVSEKVYARMSNS